ncbi:hypothetical protein [Shewanella chilikensis]|uniref:Uncharacterized protein n=1 Tax=Shewanella chilikensis TaxID=558541 RepID=A0ABX5PKV5_9GAMM|nr:hypothetical protein [Shewanella chilikensis]MCL1155339.1 hypothetical protein [Shewanella chilikensis]PYE57008.1 hypothetical protein C8J23_12527 [Shewanella chilikensis]GGZ37172.1 hypothetical protein GCM10007105_25370 [Shewanella chilikensis]
MEPQIEWALSHIAWLMFILAGLFFVLQLWRWQQLLKYIRIQYPELAQTDEKKSSNIAIRVKQSLESGTLANSQDPVIIRYQKQQSSLRLIMAILLTIGFVMAILE